MTPDTGMTSDMGADFDNETVAKAVAAIEPGGAPAADSDDFKAVLEKQIPVTMYFGDYRRCGSETRKWLHIFEKKDRLN